MKKIIPSYETLLDLNKILDVYHTIRVNSKHKDKLFNFEVFFSCNINSIYNVLLKRSYKHGKYNIFLLKKPKYRIIMSENMTDKIINHLVSKYILFPVIDPKLLPMNVATRKNKGTKLGIFYIKKYINSLKINYEKIYVLKCDIRKYFYSIDHEILLNKLKNIFYDKEIISLLEEIINSTNFNYINDSIEQVVKSEERRLNNLHINDLKNKLTSLYSLPKYKKNKGLPIGNMTSQILAIFYLNDLDHYIKEKLKIKHYIRYMDDFILFHHDKDYLKFCLKEIENILSDLKLELNNKTQIIEIHNGFSFLGYKFILNKKKLHILLNSKTKRRIKKRIKTLENDNNNKDQVIASYKGYLMQADCSNFCHNLKIDDI